MTQIAVERRRGMPWWALLLIILAAILVVWLFMAAFDRDSAAIAGANEETAAAEAAAGGAITQLATVLDASDPTTLAGREVSTEATTVLSVTSDRVFWIGENEGRQIPVVLNEQPTPNQPQTEGRYDVNPGQMVRVNGHVREFAGFDAVGREWGLDSQVRSNWENQKVYIEADSLDITHRP